MAKDHWTTLKFKVIFRHLQSKEGVTKPSQKTTERCVFSSVCVDGVLTLPRSSLQMSGKFTLCSRTKHSEKRKKRKHEDGRFDKKN